MPSSSALLYSSLWDPTKEGEMGLLPKRPGAKTPRIFALVRAEVCEGLLSACRMGNKKEYTNINKPNAAWWEQDFFLFPLIYIF